MSRGNRAEDRVEEHSLRIHVYYHCYLAQGWEALVREQVERFQNCGLYAAAQQVVFGVIGEDEAVRRLVSGYSDGEKTRFVVDRALDRFHEGKTLACLHEDACQQRFDIAWYLHTKGITHTESPVREHVRDWRHLMEHFLLDRWKEGVTALQDGYDLYGVNWQGPSIPGTEDQPYHFSGNFFAARADYIARLPAPIEPGPHMGFGRLSNEFWVGQAARSVQCPHRSHINHYLQPYPATNYR